MRMRTIGFASIGAATPDPARDSALIPALRSMLPADVRVVERANFTGLTDAEIAALGPEPGEVGIVAPLPGGGETLVSHKKILPRMQRLIDALVEEDGADLVVILCGADWSAITSPKLVVNPGRLFPGIVSALAYGRKLGIIKPSPGQIEAERERYRRLGIDAFVTAASPSAEDRVEQAHKAAEQIRDAGAELVWMTCVGMDDTMRAVVAEVTNLPVIFARSILGRVLCELVTSAQPARV